MSENTHLDEHQVRLQKLTQLKEAGVIPYANKFDKQQSSKDLIELGKDESILQDIDQLMEQGAVQKYSSAGRLMMFRSHGKLSFGTIRDDVGDIQISFVRGKCQFNTGKSVIDAISIAGGDVSSYKFVEKFFDIGDFIGVKGDLFVTKHGELTLFVDEYQMLSKALRPLGDKWHGIKDEEAIYRQRYLDMTMNHESYDRFVLKSNVVKEVRKFYWSQGFHEIETSVLGNSASGTAAQPFVTHHNAYDLDVYLRVATEPQNKMATVGRFEKVFEIGKDFRNEGTDPTHLQEFTMIEHYAVYRNYEDNMKFTENLFDHLFKTLQIPCIRKVKNKAGEIKDVDFTTPRQRIDYINQIKKDSGIDVSEYGPEDEKALRECIRNNGHERSGLDVQATATMIDYLYKKVTRPQILGPAFIYNYPKTMQPLARRNDENTGIVEQFQLIVNGVEILKAYSELVDPIEQQNNFDEQKEAQERGDEETTAADNDFVLAMEHGMPPQSGRGMGIERLCAILMEQDNLRDVTMFPLMKPQHEKSETSENEILTTSYEGNSESNSKSFLKSSTSNQNIGKDNRVLLGEVNDLQNNTIVVGGHHDNFRVRKAVRMIAEYDGKIALLYNSKYKNYSLPGGGVESGESLEESLVREAKEEAGVVFKDFVKLGKVNKHRFSKEVKLFEENYAYIGYVQSVDKPEFDKKERDEGYIRERYTVQEAYTLLINQQKVHKGSADSISRAINLLTESEIILIEEYMRLNQVTYGVVSDSVADTRLISQSQISSGSVNALVEKYLTDTKLHCQQVGFVMKSFANQLGEDETLRHTVGLLHDIDRDHIGKVAPNHLGEEFDIIMDELSADDHLRRAIKSHYPDGTGVQPENLLEKYLISVDELTGFLYAYARMRPEGYEGMKWKSINKKIKDKGFASGVDRDHLRNCEQYLGIPLAEFALSVVSVCNHQDFPTV